MTISCLLQQVVKCIIEGPIHKSMIAAVTIDKLSHHLLQEAPFLPKKVKLAHVDIRFAAVGRDVHP